MVTIDIFTVVGIASLVLQLSILILLVFGYQYKRKLKFRQHGLAMASATILHLASISAIMIPSLVYAVLPEYVAVSPLDFTSLVSVTHVVLGSVAVGLALWFTIAWRFRKGFVGCFNRRKPMLYTFIVWLSALVFGVMLFVIFYVPRMMG